MEKISHDELDLMKDSVDSGVVPGHCDLIDVNVDSNDSVTGLSELDGVATDTTEGVHYDPTGHDLGDVLSNLLRCDTVPGLLIQHDSLIVPREQSVPLGPIFVDPRGVVGVGVSVGLQPFLRFRADI